MSFRSWNYRLFCVSFVFRSCRSSFILFIFRRFFCFAITSFFIHIFHEVIVDSFIVFVFFFIFFPNFWLSRFVFTSFWFGRFWFSRFIFFFTCIFTRSYRSVFFFTIFWFRSWCRSFVFFFTCIFTRGYWCFIFFLASFCIFCFIRLYSCATIIWFHFFLWP